MYNHPGKDLFMEEMRIQKYLASCGVASRRKAEELVAQGLVKINGKPAQIGDKVDPGYDKVEVKGQWVRPEKKKIYVMLYKPEGIVTTSSDEQGRGTVLDLVKDIQERIYPVGRLDMNTQGLLFLTNDGEFANQITHPKNKIEKTYLAHVKGGELSYEELKKLRRGVELEDGMTQPARVDVAEVYEDGTTLLKIVIHEGRNRQVRRMLEAVGHPVLQLKRSEIGGVSLGNLPYGKWRHLKPGEIERLLGGKN